MEIGELEEKVLLAILQKGEGAHGAAVRDALKQAGRDVTVGALWVTVDRLEKKGFVVGREDEVPSPRGGKLRRFFRVTGEGSDALRKSDEMRSKLRLPLLAGGGA